MRAPNPGSASPSSGPRSIATGGGLSRRALLTLLGGGADKVSLHGLDGGTVAAVSVATGHLRWQTRSRLGPIGPVTPAGDALLVPVQGTDGGMIGFRHDATGTLVDEASPSSFRPLVALRNYVVAFALTSLILLGFFRYVLGGRLRRARESRHLPSGRLEM